MQGKEIYYFMLSSITVVLRHGETWLYAKKIYIHANPLEAHIQYLGSAITTISRYIFM
jgi:hypothetical protein